MTHDEWVALSVDTRLMQKFIAKKLELGLPIHPETMERSKTLQARRAAVLVEQVG